MTNNDNHDSNDGDDGYDEVNNDIAIIGMAGRFPKADNIDEFWTNLVSSTDCITRFSREELAGMGVSPAALDDPNFVPAAGFVADQDKFDAHFFEMNPREAAHLDPQHRFALEVAWQTLEHAGYTPESVKGSVGVFAGVNMSTYFIFNLLKGDEATSASDALDTQISVDKDMFASRISYKLNLNGPSVALGTACSTSLVCIHLACQSLLNGESKMALAGGSHIATPNCTGHIYHQGGYSSPDGYCRAFDAKGQGTVGGAGTCFVLLKRMEDALADNDTIYAVIKGSAVNNDGSEKIGYTAPSIVGQTNIIAEAQAVAGVEPDTIRFIEAHGTATELGDPIEFTALTRAFRLGTDKKNFCGIGSVKTNIGHLGVAAGAASVIKTALALKNRVIPESLHFEAPNPKLDIDNSPFYVLDKLERIVPGDTPARAGVSSLGIGGTNAHVVLEEAPYTESSATRDWQLVLLSAKTPGALDRMTENLSAFMAATPNENIGDVAYTLQVGRRGFGLRRAFVLPAGKLPLLAPLVASNKGFTGRLPEKKKKVVFIFPGGGTQYIDMARGLYRQEAFFRQALDECAALFKRKMGLDLIALMYPAAARAEENSLQLQKPKHFFAALFAVEYSLARLWMHWGVKPNAMIGHSLGEYTAACIAGVFSLEQAADLICCRGALFEKIDKGAMLSVTLPADEARALLIDGVSIAAVNDPGRCVVAGYLEPVQRFEALLAEKQIEFKRLLIDTAGHSPMVDAILPEFGEFLRSVRFGKPTIPLVSNMSGDWAQAAEICTSDYWKNHLRQTVRFADGVALLLKDDDSIFIEMGPGNALCSFVRAQMPPGASSVLLNSLRHVKEEKEDFCHLLETMGKLWMAGIEIDWSNFHAQEKRKRIGLPVYPFERKSYWVDNSRNRTQADARLPVPDWLWQPAWRLQNIKRASDGGGMPATILAFVDDRACMNSLVERLRRQGSRVVTVAHGSAFLEGDADHYEIDATSADDYLRLLKRLADKGVAPSTIVHAWCLSQMTAEGARAALCHLSFVYLAQALERCGHIEPLTIVGLTSRREAVLEEDAIDCSQALIAGPAQVIPFEYPHLRFLTIDVDAQAMTADEIAASVAAELQSQAGSAAGAAGMDSTSIAYRKGLRFVREYVPLDTTEPADTMTLRTNGIYLITGGLGGVGMVHAQALAGPDVRLVLLQRGAFPVEDRWHEILDDAAADEVVKTQIKSIRALREAGAEVDVVSADVTDAAQVTQAIGQIRQRCGAISGLVHCAGYGEFVPVKETTRNIVEAVLAPKVAGTDHLLAALSGDMLDFVILCSSMSVATTGFGLVGYVGACAYLDALAHAHLRNDGNPSTRIVSIDWDIWNTPQQVARARKDGVLAQRLAGHKSAITPAEGVQVIRRALACGEPQVVVATTDLRQLLRNNRKMTAALQTAADDDPMPMLAKGDAALYERPSLSTEYVAPSTPEEKLLASIWQETLGIGKIGVNDNFFELGGESLLGVKIVVKAKKMGLDIDPKQMFATPTIAQITRNLASKPGTASSPIAASQPLQAADRYRLSPLQREIYARYADTSRPPANITQALSVMEGVLDKGLLQSVWQVLIARHRALRTRFMLDERGEPVQVIAPQAAFSLIEHDYADMDEDTQRKALDTLLVQDRQNRYDLSQAPAMRLHWVKLAPSGKRFAILLSQHQIILDGWTSSLLSQDLFACLASLAAGTELPPMPGHADYAGYLDWLARQDNEDCRSWWRAMFAGYRPVDPLRQVMAASPLHVPGEDSYADHAMTTEEGLLADINACARSTQTTANSVFQAAWALTLAQLRGDRDIVYGIAISGRAGGFDGVESVVGQCTNSLPVRISLDDRMTAAQLLQTIHAANGDVQSHNGLSSSQVAELAGLARGTPLYSSNFIFENVPRAASAEGDLPIKTLASKWVDGWHFPLRVFVVPEDTTWIRFAYDPSRFAAGDVAALAARFMRNLAAISAAPGTEISMNPEE